MRKIDSQALDVLAKALDLSGQGSPVTELTDGVVDQVIEVGPIIRRSRTQADTEGIYSAVIRNVHAAANSITATINPYNAGTTAIAPYPTPMPRGFDIWLLTAVVTQISGTGTVSAALRVNVRAGQMGISSFGAATASNQNVAFWDTIVDENILFAVKGGVPTPIQRIGMRLPRDPLTGLVFSTTSSAIASFDCYMMLGVFPSGLGQDVIV